MNNKINDNMYHEIRTDKFSTAYEICKLLESFGDVVFGVEVKSYEFIISFAFEVGDSE